ncbi:lysine N(6)-hydroxylase/L-ornithine N(5)-oxygenase family protein [Saccharopolyspora sp. HNM0986]|uniref:lysine N(6)-hydroxylase/L-ornithine N(5)-oxygenase family protein n=1 Tax=Saccharopolyspora galaxeae TaxID=2781241 RepID=UPI0027DB416D|nr:lysine N(6)-hydroxylase/L-ornithine N(5)-oxygenase family protein [Saccharopolyspora sp. HNM0986]MBK0868147.1 lysine N(6)-hydroxylase/L-ornithine N(5)-oxygenase family protein [Saccharopolyspora sp. HNM0986]
MSTASIHLQGPVHDVLGVGFGPSNLALAVAVEEHNRRCAEQEQLTAGFVERQPRFGWHRGMLIEGTTMQVSFLKDLVTMRDPASDFSFLSYLHGKDRLVDFINHKTMFPTRVEYHDYLEWAAGRLEHLVQYDAEVIDVRPVQQGELFEVLVRHGSGQVTARRARNVVVAVGLEANLPPGAERGDRVWHNLELLHRIGELEGADPKRFTIVGAGQSAAEVTDYLHRTFTGAEVCSVFGRYGHTPADDSPFANRIFDPEAVDHFYSSPTGVKQLLMDYHRNTNYSVVDLELIEQLYARVYQEKVQGKERLRMLNASRVVDVEEGADGVAVTVEFMPTGERMVLDSDVLVYATGCLPGDPGRALGRTWDECLRDAEGQVQVDRDYRVRTSDEVRGGIYLQGGTEHTHGITSSLLSNGAVRAGDIRDSILRHRNAPRSAPRRDYALSGDPC